MLRASFIAPLVAPLLFDLAQAQVVQCDYFFGSL